MLSIRCKSSPPAAGNYGFGQSNALYNRLAQHNGNTTRQFTYGDTLSWTRGAHAFKFGGEFRPQDSKGYTNLGTNPYPRLSTGAGALPLASPERRYSNLGGTTLQTLRNDAASLAYLLSGSLNLMTQAYWIDSFTDIQEGKWQSIVTSPDVFRTVITNEMSGFRERRLENYPKPHTQSRRSLGVLRSRIHQRRLYRDPRRSGARGIRSEPRRRAVVFSTAGLFPERIRSS